MKRQSNGLSGLLGFFMVGVLGIGAAGCVMSSSTDDVEITVDSAVVYEPQDGPAGGGNGLNGLSDGAAIDYIMGPSSLGTVNAFGQPVYQSWVYNDSLLMAFGSPTSALRYMTRVGSWSALKASNGQSYGGEGWFTDIDESLLFVGTTPTIAQRERVVEAVVGLINANVGVQVTMGGIGMKNTLGGNFATTATPIISSSLYWTPSSAATSDEYRWVELGINVKKAGNEFPTVRRDIWVSHRLESWFHEKCDGSSTTVLTQEAIANVVKKRSCHSDLSQCSVYIWFESNAGSGCSIPDQSKPENRQCVHPGVGGSATDVTTTFVQDSALPYMYEGYLPSGSCPGL